MQYRSLGNTGLSVPPIMLGGNVFGWTANEADSFRILDAAFDAGLNFIDTADIYSAWIAGNHGGESETIIGKWFARSGRRNQVILATKVGKDMGGGKTGLAPQYIGQAVEDSLRRLQTDYIDLYQTHEDDASVPLEDTLRALDSLIRNGKVRAIGASNYSGARLREAIETSKRAGLASYQTLQPLYNLVERAEYESDLAPVAAEYGLAVLPFYALATGFLTGKYRKPGDADGHARAYRVDKYLNPDGLALLGILDEIASETKSTPARISLAWLLSRPDIAAPIASVTKTEHLTDLVEAAKLTLSQSALDRLNSATAGK